MKNFNIDQTRDKVLFLLTISQYNLSQAHGILSDYGEVRASHFVRYLSDNI